MGDALERICRERRKHYAKIKAERSFASLEADIQGADPVRGFGLALANAAKRGYGLIAEIKKASPSAGLIRNDFDPPSLAKAYEQNGYSTSSDSHGSGQEPKVLHEGSSRS